MTEEAPKRHRTSDCAPARYGNWCCQRHYRRWRKTGSTEPPSRPSLSERFWAKVEKQQDGCWIWTTTTRNGYGSFTTRDGTRYAHRLSYEWHVGAIPDGLVVRHRCDNPLCVRPDHLELGSKADNSRDMVERGRSPRNPRQDRTACGNGHPFDEANTYLWNGHRQCRECKRQSDVRAREKSGATGRSSRLLGAKRDELRSTAVRRYEAGETIKQIAEAVGRSARLVRDLLIEAEVSIRARSYRSTDRDWDGDYDDPSDHYYC